MSTTLKKYDFSEARKGRRMRYNWAEWADGNIHRVVEGEDFDCRAKNFVSNLRNYAKRSEDVESLDYDTPEDGVVVFRFNLKTAKPSSKSSGRKSGKGRRSRKKTAKAS